MTIAYSYIRFSHPDQAKGDSLRRQTEAAQEWCARNKIALDESTTLRDLGKSAFTGEHRKNPDRNALAAFLKLADAGKIIKGSYLIIENLDRLSREDARPALRLWMDILDAGINIVQLSPERIFSHEQTEMIDVVFAIAELSRGNSESKIKSKRNRATMQEKRKSARKGEGMPIRKNVGCAFLTRMAPAWLEVSGKRLTPVPERAAAIKKIYSLAASGYGLTAIVKKLTADDVKPFGTAPHWARSYVSAILLDRRVMGEIQFRNKDGSNDGEPLAGYYPAIISETEWLAARAGAGARRNKATRMGKHLSLFAGLIRDARDGGTYFEVTRTDGGEPSRVLMNSNAWAGRAKCVSFPLPTFEAAVLSLLAEVDAGEITGTGEVPDETMHLAAELSRVEGKIQELESALLEGDVAALARVLRDQETKKRELSDQLNTARQKALHPLNESWGETKGLLDALTNAPDQDEARIRLRAALTRVIDEMVMLVVPRGSQRLAAVQIHFGGGARRDYLILHQAAKGNKAKRTASSWNVITLDFAVAGKKRGHKADLSVPEDVLSLEAALTSIDLEASFPEASRDIKPKQK